MATSVLAKEVDSLPLINDVIPFNQNDVPLFDELREVLAKHNALSRFGIALLHDHFELKDGEIMAEFEDTVNRQLVTKPVQSASLTTSIDTQWRLDVSGASLTCTKKCIEDANGDHTGHTVYTGH